MNHTNTCLYGIRAILLLGVAGLFNLPSALEYEASLSYISRSLDLTTYNAAFRDLNGVYIQGLHVVQSDPLQTIPSCQIDGKFFVGAHDQVPITFVYSSTDGVDWKEASIPEDGSEKASLPVQDIIWSGKEYLAVGITGLYLVSPDANDWAVID